MTTLSENQPPSPRWRDVLQVLALVAAIVGCLAAIVTAYVAVSNYRHGRALMYPLSEIRLGSMDR
jgi:hypothetical protein